VTTRSLTQDEARERAELLAVERYDLAVDLTALPDGPEVRCVATVTFTCRRPGAGTFVDCAARVVSAELNGVRLAAAADGRIELPALEQRNVLRVETVQDETTEGEGVHRAVDPADGAVYLWTTFEPDQAHHVWACFDQPDLKAEHQFTVTAPADWRVVTNTGDPRVETDGDTKVWTFPPTPRLSPYNTVVNAGPLHEVRRTAGGHDLGLFARRSLAEVLERDADELFTVTEQGLRFFGDTFALPFPQTKYDHVFMPEFSGAMENFGCVTWNDAALTRTPSTAAERQSAARVLLHEMAHMWFGNIVTMRWWDDLWLNEAFAEFACYWAAERATVYTDAWASFLAAEKLRAYLADRGPTSHPIRLPVRDVAEAASIFDAITYPKGASVLHQLMTYVGEESFVAGMRAYFAQHRWGVTTLQDLIDSLAAASGRDLEPWRSGWLETAGTDLLTLAADGDGLVLTGAGPDGPPRPQVVTVGAFGTAGAALRRTASATVEVTGRRTPVDLPTDADFYLVNDLDLTFATTRPDLVGRERFFAQAPGLPDVISRGVAIATARDMLTTGEATPAEVVGLILDVLAAETAEAVVAPYLELAQEIAELWSSDAGRPALLARLTATARGMLADPDRRRVARRVLAAVAVSPAELDEVRRSAPDDVDLHWRILLRAATLGADTDDEVQRLLAADPDPDGKFRAAAVRAATPDADRKADAWRAMADDREVPVAAMPAVSQAFWRPGQDALLAPFAERYLALIPQLDGRGMISAMNYTLRLFPLYAVDTAFLDRVEAAAGDSVTPVVRKSLLARVDLMRRILRARAAKVPSGSKSGDGGR
jgi:aminopeptidase N